MLIRWRAYGVPCALNVRRECPTDDHNNNIILYINNIMKIPLLKSILKIEIKVYNSHCLHKIRIT